MSLSELPPELLNTIAICANLHHLDLCNLWLIGSKLLNAKIANGLAELRISFNPLFFPTWPSILLQMTHLARLEIKNSHGNPNTPLPTTWITHISNTVKELNLHCTGAFTAFHDVLRMPNAFPLLEKVRISGISGEEQGKNNTVAHWPKTLTSLILAACTPHRLLLDVASLPPHLTILSGDFYKLVNHSNCAFPEPLKSLKLKLCRFTCDWIPLLPTGLKTLSASISLSGVEDQDDMMTTKPEMFDWALNALAQLPRGLTALNWPFMRDYSRKALLALPLSLESLSSGGTVDARNFDALPRSLTYFSTLASPSGPPIAKESLHNLPSGVVQLHLDARALAFLRPAVNVRVTVSGSGGSFSHGMIESQLTTLPPQITALTLPTSRDFQFEMFPSTLTSLTIQDGGINSLRASLLPQGLKELIMPYGPPQLEAEVWERLPSLLERLDTDIIGVLPAESYSRLPTSLHSIRAMTSAIVPTDRFEGLPSNLLEVRFRLTIAFNNNPVSEWCPCFPPNLTRLSLILVLLGGSDKQSACVMERIVLSLPPSLKDLSITLGHHSESIPYSPSLLAMLPRRLQTLELPRNVLFSNAELARRMLPKSLLSVSFGKDTLILDAKHGCKFNNGNSNR